MICCLPCRREMIADPRADELRAGRLRHFDHAGHARYVEVAPVQTEAEALLDAIIAGDRAHRGELAASRRVKDRAARAGRGRPTAWPAERIAQLYALWVEGASPAVMGEAVGLAPRSVYPQVTQLRQAGHDFPERPRGGAARLVRAVES